MSTATPAQPQLSPVETMLQMMSGFWISRGLWIAAKLGIADLLKDGDKSVEELAAATETHPGSLFRVLRMLASVGVFEQKGEDRFAITPLSELLLSDAPFSLRSGIIAEMGEVHYDSWGNILHSVKTGEIAFDNKFGMNVWQYFEKDPAKAQNFNKWMVDSSASVGQPIVEAYDFGKSQKIIDLGGGLGSMISAILKANQNLSGVLFDAPSVIEKAKDYLAANGVSDRCETIGGNFFEAVPEGGDLYYMRWIIHDWDDDLSIKILKNIRQVIPADGKLLLLEAVVPDDNKPHFSKFMDLIMLAMTGGCERTAKQYEALLEKAGFKVTNVIPTNSFMSIVEAVPV
jgi:ubiquinone/menaquinone biosynthesis C-methylase UbiE